MLIVTNDGRNSSKICYTIGETFILYCCDPRGKLRTRPAQTTTTWTAPPSSGSICSSGASRRLTTWGCSSVSRSPSGSSGMTTGERCYVGKVSKVANVSYFYKPSEVHPTGIFIFSPQLEMLKGFHSDYSYWDCFVERPKLDLEMTKKIMWCLNFLIFYLSLWWNLRGS